MMQQYEAAKREHPDALLFFRMGDFFEMFKEDAQVASKALGLEPAHHQEDPLVEREAHDALHRSLSSLNPRQQLALVLRYFQGMSTRQISTALECSEGTARNILFRGLRQLRATLIAPEEVL